MTTGIETFWFLAVHVPAWSVRTPPVDQLPMVRHVLVPPHCTHPPRPCLPPHARRHSYNPTGARGQPFRRVYPAKDCVVWVPGCIAHPAGDARHIRLLVCLLALLYRDTQVYLIHSVLMYLPPLLKLPRELFSTPQPLIDSHFSLCATILLFQSLRSAQQQLISPRIIDALYPCGPTECTLSPAHMY